MTYSTEASKWSAFQFKDPFAADQFYVCNKITKVCCRPNCDMGGSNVAKDDIFFVESIDKIGESGFTACKFCLPEKYSINYMNQLDGSFVEIDLELLVNTVKFVNKSISFIEPLMNEEEEKNNVLKANALKSSLGVKARNGVPPSPASSLVDSQEGSISKNDCNHLKLIDLACRHIALAALSTSGISSIENEGDIRSIPSPSSSTSSNSSLPQEEKRGKRKRRGGVLGFKELASKSKLSPWHFHRVFKNITGVTPKSYGDKCWQFIVKQERKEKSVSKRSSIIINSQIANPTLCNESGDEDKTSEDTLSSRKRKGEIIESCNENKRLDTERKIYQRLDFNNDTNLLTNVHIDGSSLSSSSPSTASSSVSSAYSRFSSQSPIESDTFVELFKSPTEFQQQLATSLSENPTGSDSQGLVSNYQMTSMQYNNNSHYDQTINSFIQSLQEQQHVQVQQHQTQQYHHSNESQVQSNGPLNFSMFSNSLFDSSINSDIKNNTFSSLNSNNNLSDFNLDELVSSSVSFDGKDENAINSSIFNFDISDLSAANDDFFNQQQLQYQLQLQQQMFQHQPSHCSNISNQVNATGLNTPRLFLDEDEYLFSNNFSAVALDNNCFGELY